jgi:hypothetical protein
LEDTLIFCSFNIVTSRYHIGQGFTFPKNQYSRTCAKKNVEKITLMSLLSTEGDKTQIPFPSNICQFPFSFALLITTELMTIKSGALSAPKAVSLAIVSDRGLWEGSSNTRWKILNQATNADGGYNMMQLFNGPGSVDSQHNFANSTRNECLCSLVAQLLLCSSLRAFGGLATT